MSAHADRSATSCGNTIDGALRRGVYRWRYVFVGERPSPLAAARGWTWADGRVCAGTLRRALEHGGIDLARCRFMNLWSTPGLGPALEAPALDPIRAAQEAGDLIVALGRRVERELLRAAVPHCVLIHPAARGTIRRRAVYATHVRAVLRAAAEAVKGSAPHAATVQDRDAGAGSERRRRMR